MRSFGGESLHGPVTFSSFYGFIFPGVFQVFYNTACNLLFLLKDCPVLIPASAITNSDALVLVSIKKETAHALGVQMAGSLWKPKLEAVRSEGSEEKGGAGTGTLSLSSLSFSS